MAQDFYLQRIVLYPFHTFAEMTFRTPCIDFLRFVIYSLTASPSACRLKLLETVAQIELFTRLSQESYATFTLIVVLIAQKLLCWQYCLQTLISSRGKLLFPVSKWYDFTCRKPTSFVTIYKRVFGNSGSENGMKLGQNPTRILILVAKARFDRAKERASLVK